MASGFDALADLVRGATFDDFLLRPQYSVIARRDPAAIDLSCRFSTHITLKRPLVSANMDTVTRAPMAIVQAEEGGIGIIDRGFRNGDIEPQVREVAKVKRMQHIIIRDPYSVTPETPLAEAVALMRRRRAGTLVVVDGDRKLKGLLTERDVRFVNTREGTVASRMTPVDALVTGEGELTLAVAEQLMVQRKIKKLPLVDRHGTLIGLITAKDIHRQERLPFATRDAHGRLRVGAAIGATGDFIERAAELVKAHVDVIVIDIAHGHSIVMGKAIDAFRKAFPDLELVAGNVATAEGVRFLAERGVNAVKVGIGPGGGCTTRLTTSFGVPQLQALYECRQGAGDDGAADRRRRHQAPRRDPRGAAVRRRHRDARQHVRRHRRNARRGRAEVGGPARSAALGEGAVQGAARHGVDPGDPRSARRRRRRRRRPGIDRRRRHRGQRAGARIGAADHPRHLQAPLLVDQLRRRQQPGGAAARCSAPIRCAT